MKKRNFLVLAGALALVGIGLIIYKPRPVVINLAIDDKEFGEYICQNCTC